MNGMSLMEFLEYSDSEGLTPGETIKQLRRKFKISQANLAKEIGITQQAVALLETGKRKIDLETLGKILEFFRDNYFNEPDSSILLPFNLSNLLDRVPTDKESRISFYEWVSIGCGIGFKECISNGVKGYMFNTDNANEYKYFIPEDLFDSLRDVLVKYTKAIIKANHIDTLTLSEEDSPE